MLFLVHKTNIELSDNDKVNENEINVTECEFVFDEEYGDLARKAVFTNSVEGISYEVPITNNKCFVPYEVCNNEGHILVGVFAYDVEDNKVIIRYSPTPAKVKINKGSYVKDPADSGIITPTQYEIYEAALASALERLNQEIAKLDEAYESGELNGPANTLSIGTVTGGATAAASITGDSPNQTLSLVLPKGDKGNTGPANTLSIGTVVSGTTASATITGTAPNQTLNLVLPKGDTGPQGTTDYDDLENRPTYNSQTITSETNIPEVITYNAFTGTDGVTAGTTGLVPAPTTTDVDKFLKSDGTWDTAGGGGGPTVVQTTGTSTTDVMSQNATTGMVFQNPGTDNIVRIGNSSTNSSNTVSIGYSSNALNTAAVAIGNTAQAQGMNSAAIGSNTLVTHRGSVALGSSAQTTSKGQIMVGTTNTYDGYDSSNYRLISGVYDGQAAHDAVTVGQVNGLIDAINTALSTSIPHIGASS
jgi:hypothetical protein